MVRPEVIRKRIEKIDEYVSVLERIQNYSLEEFRNEPERYGSAERFLQLAIESINDAASHVIAETGAGSVDQYADLPEIFAREGWIDEERAEQWIAMIGFRNILVHDYLEIDRTIVYEVLQERLDEIRALQRALAEFL